MKERQKFIIIELLKNKIPLNTESMAEKLSCSERTIRNDLNKIEKWIDVHTESKVILKKKPGVGTYLEADDEDRNNLLNLIKEYQSEYELEKEDRQKKILFNLLMSNKPTTIDELSDQFYESKKNIRNDLEVIGTSISEHQLYLTIEPRIGVTISGEERKKRNLLAQVMKISKQNKKEMVYLADFFKKSDVEKVKETVDRVDPKLLDDEDSSLLSSIVIHILFMIERIKNNSTLQLRKEEWALVYNTGAYNKSESITKELSKELGLPFPKDEIGYLGLRIASIQMSKNSSNIDSREKVEEAVDETIGTLITNVNEILDVNLSNDAILKRNLTLHLESAFLRVISDFHISNPLMKEIRNTYMHLFLTIQVILEDFSEKYGVAFPEEEVAYLTVHFKAALERTKEETDEYKAVITCDHGVGVSSFLEAKIDRHFPQLNVVDLLTYKDLETYPLQDNIDLVISTRDDIEIDFPHIVVSPLMDDSDVEKLQSFVTKKQRMNKPTSFDINKYTNTFLIEPQLDVSSKEACLSFMCEHLEQKGYIDHHYKNSVFEREESSSTRIGRLVAIPHGNTKHVKESGIYIASLKKPIEWGNGEVQLVLLLAFHKKDLGLTETKKLFSVLYDLIENKDQLDSLLSKTSSLEIMKALSRYH